MLPLLSVAAFLNPLYANCMDRLGVVDMPEGGELRYSNIKAYLQNLLQSMAGLSCRATNHLKTVMQRKVRVRIR